MRIALNDSDDKKILCVYSLVRLNCSNYRQNTIKMHLSLKNIPHHRPKQAGKESLWLKKC